MYRFAGSGLSSSAQRRATGFAVGGLALLMAARLTDNVISGMPGETPFTVALFVLPLLYAFGRVRGFLIRYRWHALAVQAVLTWVPFAVFGSQWQVGIGGLLAGLVLLNVPGRKSWLLAAGCLAAEVVVRAAVTGLPVQPAWFAVLYVVAYYADDALLPFGMLRLTQILGDVEDAQRQAAVGQRLASVAAQAAAARRALASDGAAARAQMAAAGTAAREAVARARALAAGDSELDRREPIAAPPAGVVIGARLAWAVLVGVLAMFAAENTGYMIQLHYSAGLTAIAVGDMILAAGLQLYHSSAVRNGRRPRVWPLTLALQAMLAYAFMLPFVWAYIGVTGPFLAGSVLLLVPGRWRWAGYTAVVTSYSVLSTVLPLHGSGIPAGQRFPVAVFYAAITAGVGLMVYGLSRVAGLTRQLEELRGELARMAAVRERLRVARDVHDLLGLGLSAIALKADLIGALIGRDDTRAAAELDELSRICAAARADIRLVTGPGGRLSLPGELSAATQILASAGLEVSADIPCGSLPAAADDVLAPVLREAVTNILRHSRATACTIEVTAGEGVLRLRVANNGVLPEAAGQHAGSGGCGLANLTARVRAAGGWLESCSSGDLFELTAHVPLGQLGEPGIDDPLPGGHRAHGGDQLAGRAVLEQVAGYTGT
jgi:two-component system sensor histidine kinase DesK